VVPWVLLLAGCLERVTGEAVPLDPRFYEGRDDHGGAGRPGDGAGGGDGAPGGGGGGGGSPSGGGEAPWSGYDGATWTLTGIVEVDEAVEVQLDLNEVDADAPGGQRRAGAIRLAGAGPFEVRVPGTVNEVRLQAFQDLDADGPDEGDPFAEASVTWTGADPAAVTLTLVKGGRGRAGAPGGGGASGSPSPPPDGLTFPAGPTVTLAGTTSASRDLPVILDFFKANGEGAGGRSYLGRRTVAVGAWSQAFPVGYGSVEVEAYQDLTGDSRTGDDPAARSDRAVTIGEADVSGVTLTIP
jgi:hypothetical protein